MEQSMQLDIEYGPTPRSSSLAGNIVFALAARIEAGELTMQLPDGSVHVFAGRQPGPSAELEVCHTRAFRRLLLGGTLGFAESYMDADCDSPDLAALVELAIRNEEQLLVALNRRRWTRAVQRLGHWLRPNSRHGARRNIARHYDLGNDFYALWLDPSMTYSSAVFERAKESIHTAQNNKYQRIAELADIKPTDHVLEIGCGWGGFCSWVVRHVGCRVTAITISRAQFEYAARRLQAEGLAEHVDLRLQDYRDVDGTFDKIVSIEMLEAVGERYWPRYFATLRDRLAPGGRAALQVITIDDDLFDSYRRDIDFIRQYIFPGGLLPSSNRLRHEVQSAGLNWQTDDGLAQHYAQTLALWRRNFEAAWPQCLALGFDERFRRMWRYYLASCEAGFKTGRIDVLQLAVSKT